MNSGGKRQAWLQSIMDACKQRADNAGRLAWTRLEDQCVCVCRIPFEKQPRRTICI